MSASSEAEAAPGKQNGENFNDEMKDYAKSTMNELLGMFGYEEAITREAVEELQIRLLPDEDDDQHSSSALDKPTEAEDDATVSVNIDPSESPVVVQYTGDENGGNPSVVPMPVVNNGTGSAAIPEVIPETDASQPAPEVSIVPSGPSDSGKTGTALAPHFLADPPNVKGVYCVVASLPVVNSTGKTNMIFKFWNCIMCSAYFYQKPEVVFRVEHPHLFGSHPDWLYQAAVCVKCHQSLKAAKQSTSPALHPKEVSSISDLETTNDNKVEGASLTAQLPVTNSSSATSHPSYETHKVVSGAEEVDGSAQFEDTSEVLFDCYICSKQVHRNSRPGKLRRSKFPTLFSSLPESSGTLNVCLTCGERMARQRDRYMTAGISEEDRDYVAHIKIWTGQDIRSKFSSSSSSSSSSCSSKNSDCSTCFVCDKYITDNLQQEVKTLNRSKFPSLFSVVPDQIVKLIICDACSRKLLKVKGRFDENNTVEEERDYWVYINSWRDQKGLERHMYST